MGAQATALLVERESSSNRTTLLFAATALALHDVLTARRAAPFAKSVMITATRRRWGHTPMQPPLRRRDRLRHVNKATGLTSAQSYRMSTQFCIGVGVNPGALTPRGDQTL